MVALRLTRIGAKKKPSYRLVAIDSRRARDSKTIEILGHYNPRPDPIEIDLKRERIDYWLGVGAQPSDTAQRLIKYFDANGAHTAQPKREAAQKAAADNKPAPKPVAVAPAPAPAPAPKIEEVEAEATAAEAENGSSEVVAEAVPATEAPVEAVAAEATPAAEAPPEAAVVEEAPAAEAPAEEADKA
ncbi:MAG: 30S ribosomal protein S16 [Acidobacteria bacterium]|nr:30S ribosomal protein S16 [Acidobacteriota bacterium]MDA1235253.1 30S ribosomal protein S16 [Acidobacteriota bacterium]